MAHLLASNPTTSDKLICPNFTYGVRTEPRTRNACCSRVRRKSRGCGRKGLVLQCCSSSTSSSQLSYADQNVGLQIESDGGKLEQQVEYLVCEYGWMVRRLIENKDETRQAAQVQAEAFHIPVALFNDLFFQFFQAEVLAGLLYKLKNSPPNRYACLVAEPAKNDLDSPHLVGVTDVTVLRDQDVLQHLPAEAEEYLYISGIAVSKTFRRRKIATALLKACDMLSILWGFEFLALRAYEDDLGARKVYANAGYQVVSRDPPWTSNWIGRKPRVLMIKRTSLPK
ncbi:GCN5-related N-acetyltransferase 10, chloroplastic [Lotus japonicus]|uniref:N-acetyltransferase domain-containing protein n=1 Tax=Lotus japonicus TaxID=34305 RepID=I3SAE9_LOTJA|nr:GCN5-related N-acetyltransferase 10, chloroplastic [Lotus japonicus]AFK37241.1 unknown [Lotus japonicus]